MTEFCIKKYSKVSLFVMIFLILSFLANALVENTSTIIEDDVFNKLKEEDRAHVFVMLKESVEYKNALSIKERNEKLKRQNQEVEKIRFKVEKDLNQNDINFKHKFLLTPAFSGFLSKEGLTKLSSNPNVERISLVKPIHATLTQSVPIINADDVQNLNYKGDGVTVCVIDTGINYTHTDLGNCAVTSNINDGSCIKVIGGHNYCANNACTLENENPIDNEGHGTHVSGIVASNSTTFKGVAPNAKLVAIKVLNASGRGSSDDLAAGIEWCRNNASKLNISIITISIGFEEYFDTDCNDAGDNVEDNINQAYNDGIFVSVASGNENKFTGISRPSCAAGAVSVGSVYDADVGIESFEPCTDFFTKSDKISCFTNRAKNLDLLAPGCEITSTSINGGYETQCGTSQATPHVAGSAALLQDVYDSTLTPDQIIEALNASGKSIHDSYLFFFFKITFSRIDVEAALDYLPVLDIRHFDWPAENHDFRRTGFTLLKGDLTSASKVKNQINLALDAVESTEQVVKPTVADLDNNGFMDSVVLVHKTTFNTYTKMYGVENQKIKLPYSNRPYYRTRQKWGAEQIDGGAIWFPASLGNIDSDSRKEIVTGTRNGTVYAYDVASNGKVSKKWAYYLEKRFAPLPGTYTVNFNGGTAIADIDLDGTNEIIFADVGPAVTEANWDGKVYVLDGSGSTPSLEASASVGNGGTYASISVANVDSDDYPEIIVPTQYGIRVYDYSGGSLSLKCSNSHGLIEGSAVVYDVDRDNEYELVYVTSNRACASGKTCANKLYVINASSCTIEFEKTFTEMPRPTPTVANLDSDSQSEIIVSSVSSLVTGLGTISAVDSSSGTTQWTYNNGGNLHPGFVSPNIADIDNDGNYNVILGENSGSTVYVLTNSGGELYKYAVSGFMDNGLAIADVDSDQLAEIVFKRAGSPTLFTSVSNENYPPEISEISNITAIAGDLIDINATGEISAVDLEGDNVQFYYSNPFNSSGLWQTGVNDTGNYSILVEASDGNSSTYRFIDVVIFNESTKVQSNFSDNSSQKLLNFAQSGNLSLTVRLPKNATILYSKIKIEGVAP